MTSRLVDAANLLENSWRGLRARLAPGRAGPPEGTVLWAMAAGLVATMLLSLMIGRCDLSPGTVLKVLLTTLWPMDRPWPPAAEVVVLSVRLPRIAADVLVGSALSASGAAFQGIFKNPLVSPDILGVSMGAGLGAALGILFSLGPVGVQCAAFACGLLAVGATYALGSWRAGSGQEGLLVLILSGMITAAVFSACISLIKYAADPYNVLPAITFWLLGSLASVGAGEAAMAALPILAGLAVVIALRFNLNVLSFGDEEARALGVEVRRVRLAVIAAATLMTASAVAISGVIGLVGLVVPHLTRLAVGPDYRTLLPACVLLGGIFMLVVDDLARTLFLMEMPLGILTSLIGAPFFVYLLSNLRKGWG